MQIRPTRRRVVVLVVLTAVALVGCSHRPDGDVTIGADTGAPPPSSTAAAPTPSDFTPTIAAGQLEQTLPPAAALGSGWRGPTDLGTRFPVLDNFLQSCAQPSRLRTGHEETKPSAGTSGSYTNIDKNVVLNTVQAAIGVDTIARAKGYLAFLRTVPDSCPTSLLQGKYPTRMALAPVRPLGDDEVGLRISVDLHDGGRPLDLENGFVRVGGLVVDFYGVPDQVDQYLPLVLDQARRHLGGAVPGLT